MTKKSGSIGWSLQTGGAKVAAISAFNIAQFAYMEKKMASLCEGDGTLLDNCITMWGSGLEDGNERARENLSFIVTSRGGGSPRTPKSGAAPRLFIHRA